VLELNARQLINLLKMNKEQKVQDLHVSQHSSNEMLSAVRCTYVLTVSEFFPKTHNKAGLPTGFINAISKCGKIHTIRANYDLWKKRADKINRGEAVLSVRYWTGKPYNSKQKEVFVFEKIGVEKLQLDMLGWFIDDIDSDYATKDFAKNDGLSEEDFKQWFKGQDFSKPKAIIHFSDFRYSI
jgi:hypothetical protein